MILQLITFVRIAFAQYHEAEINTKYFYKQSHFMNSLLQCNSILKLFAINLQ